MNLEGNSSVESGAAEPSPAPPVICPPPGEPQIETPIVLRASGLRRSFGKVQAVDEVNLAVREGEIYGFLGVNGAGKTTTIRMLMGITKPDGGTIELLGQRTRRTNLAQKRAIGYVSQEQTFYPWMTCRMLGRFVGGFYPTWDAAEFDRLLRALDMPPDRKASQLSGGMRVKLALALALAPRPALLILDEPTSGLDPVARREFLDLIQRQAHDHHRTTFFSSHLVGEVERVAHRIGIIHHGRMLFEGDLGSLRASVRSLRIPLPEAVPGGVAFPWGFEILRDEARDGTRCLIVRAPPAAWEGFQYPAAEPDGLSLEDIFIARVGTNAALI